MKDDKGIQGSGCFIGQKLIRTQPCLLGDALQQFHRGRMHTTNDVTDGRLADADTASKVHLRSPRALEPCIESFHRGRVSDFPIVDAIGRSYLRFGEALAIMAKRSFYDRAMEALRERYPRQRPTQVLLAALAGVKQPTVTEWRIGYPTMETAVRLATALDVCVEWLLTERGPKRPPKGAPDSLGPLSAIWSELSERQKSEIARYADYLKEQPKG